MATKNAFQIKKGLEKLSTEFPFLDLYEATGFFMKQTDSRVEIQYYLDPTKCSKSAFKTSLDHANKMSGDYIVRKKVLIYTPKSIILSAENLDNAPISDGELEWLFEAITKRREKDPNIAISVLFLLECKTNSLK